MFVLKANMELKNTYTRLIESTKARVDWTGLIIVNNDSLILLGKEKSLVFSMDRKSVFGDIIEKEIDESKAYIVRSTQKNIISFLNIPLYVLGKWGALKGLVVNHNYDKLNNMFDGIVSQVKVETKMTRDNIRFYKRGIRFDYEDVLNELIKNEQRLATGEDYEDEHNEYKMGLWRKIKWVTDKKQFDKINEYQKVESSDVGKNFFSVSFKCPYCKDKLYMVLFDKNKEYLIETDEQRVYLARAYTCTRCHSMFTPKPEKLLSEGDIFKIDFEDDEVAYADYASLLSDAGSRENNYNFNRYEFAKPQKKEKHLEDYKNAGYTKKQINEMIDEGFFEEDEIENYNKEATSKKKNPLKSMFKNPLRLGKHKKETLEDLSEENVDTEGNTAEKIDDAYNEKNRLVNENDDIKGKKDTSNKTIKKQKNTINNNKEQKENYVDNEDSKEEKENHVNVQDNKEEQVDDENNKDKQIENTYHKKDKSTIKVQNTNYNNDNENTKNTQTTSYSNDNESVIKPQNENSDNDNKTKDKLQGVKKLKKQNKDIYQNNISSEYNDKDENNLNNKRHTNISDLKTEKEIVKDKKITNKNTQGIAVTNNGKNVANNYDEEKTEDISSKITKNDYIKDTQINKAPKQNILTSISEKMKSKSANKEIERLKNEPQNINNNENSNSKNKPNNTIYDIPITETEIKELVNNAKAANFEDTVKIIDVINNSKVSDDKKEPFINTLKNMAKLKAKKEIADELKKDANNLTAKNVKVIKNTVQKYKDYAPELVEKIDNTSLKLDSKETKDIRNIIKMQTDSTREGLIVLKNELISKGFDDDNLKPYIDKIDTAIAKTDKIQIDKICGDMENMTYGDIEDAYDKIEKGIFLPELKNNALLMLDKRLSMIKINESTLLVKKLSKMIDSKIPNTKRIYYCNVIKMMLEKEKNNDLELVNELKSQLSEEELKEDNERADIIINNALKTYGFINNKYEYPIAVFDSSVNGNGKAGIIITDEHIFYKNVVNPGSVRIDNIKDVTSESKVLGNNILLIKENGEIIKLNARYCAKSVEPMVEILSEYVQYIKEKPKSRDLKYMAKKEHKVKCCYRCGYTFSSGNVCPKCGNVQN